MGPQGEGKLAEEPFEIRSEDDLFRAIELIEAGAWDGLETPVFIEWPRYEVIIRGEDFDGGVPTRIMPALLELQRTIRRAYARSVHGSERRLTREELKQTELVVRLEPGSTKFWSELAPLLNDALKNMTGPETVITVLGLAAVVALAVVWKARINAETQRREIAHRSNVTEEETKRYQALADLAAKYAPIAEHLSDAHTAQAALLKRLEENDRLLVGGEEVVDGKTAKRIVRAERQERIADRLDSVFMILTVDSGSVKDGFRAKVRDMASGDELLVSIPSGTLSDDQLVALQSGEWDKRPLHLEINTERLGKRILRATLTSAGLADAEES